MGTKNGQQRDGQVERGTYAVKAGLAQMLKGGVIMDVVTADQARIAEGRKGGSRRLCCNGPRTRSR